MLTALLLFVVFVVLNNASFLAEPTTTEVTLIAHRGLGQAYDREGLTGKTCTAARMIPTGHATIENTIPAIRAAIGYGADIIEIDLQRTADGRFAIFHDWVLDCRTNGTGVTREHTLEALQKLDVGYGYTPDGGKTWPLRGQGVGLMPSLDEVLSTFPDQSFFLDIKSNDASEGEMLADRLAALPTERARQIIVHGGPGPVDVVRDRLPHVRTITRRDLKQCLLRYIALGWSGSVDSSCERSALLIPHNVAPWLWGWPHRFQQRMASVGTTVAVMGDYEGGKFSSGFDDPERLSELPDDYRGGIWTDRIDLIGPAIDER
ncbi:MAG: glycerophosphodiester phosphodiesterase family protein [Acidobacteriota bacterium]